MLGFARGVVLSVFVCVCVCVLLHIPKCSCTEQHSDIRILIVSSVIGGGSRYTQRFIAGA